MTDFTLTLGGIVFQGFEVPDEIRGFGGEQMLVVNQLPGGRRIIDAMGPAEAPREWSGRFRGENALPRARALDALRKAGQRVTLSLGDIRETVTIHSFTYSVQRFYEVPYSISLEVVTDDTSSTTPTVDEMMTSDNATAQTLGASVGDGELSGLLGTLDSAISGVSSFATAAQSTIQSVLDPIAAVQARVSTLIASAENALGSVTTLGGLVPNNPISTLAASLTGQANAMTQVSSLYDLQSTAGRMSANLGAVGAGGAQVVMAGGDLYRLAEQTYGDQGEWPTIAKANGLTDPVISGVRTVLVPPNVTGADGVLQP